MEKYKRKAYSVHTGSAMVRKESTQTQSKPKFIFQRPIITSHCYIKQRNSSLKLQLNLEHIWNLN